MKLKVEYVNGLIKEYSKKSTKKVGKGYGISNLKNMRQFYLIFRKSQAVPDQLTWSHYIELLKLKDYTEIYYYIKISVEQNLSYRQLHEKIKNQEYKRLDDIAKKIISL